ncbi:sigma-54 interaction domain-containing protein [Candidatus Formimonas warabiya]|uniref:Fis family transcriptional regulator n=1 Tax=Formimonas warabiya TaxID=1761012 RepID=A0A3G1KYE9_FORW1|nr:sigma 54-interacting transcriptional regulator [Candidatus Formimonas warabiya]ATW27514.1 Fis family transcriptional regulator [Candidatus Formimonas warabiya]
MKPEGGLSPQILDSVADGVFTVDHQWKITTFNRAAEVITGISQKDALGCPCRDIFHSDICDGACILKQSIESGRPITNKSIHIIKPTGEKIPVSISAAPLKKENGEIIGGVETFRDMSEVTQLRKELQKSYNLYDIISKNDSMQRLFHILPDLAKSDSTVLILGESGTGKELVARAVHNLSDRNRKPMVVVNCGALPDTLLESELFGYLAGAFTDAKKDKPGYFARAEGGTIFLDEIGDVSPALQVKLLRVLQERTYVPLGGVMPVKADVRVIAATNKDLETLVQEAKFRQDLYYRINIAQVKLPSLQNRKEDIPLLADHFVRRFNHLKGRHVLGLAPETLAILMKYDYPGNIRELENIIEYAFILCHHGLILPEHLPEKFQSHPGKDLHVTGKTFKLAEIKKAAVLESLNRNNWKRMAVCRELGISKGTLRRMIQEYQIVEPESWRHHES